MSEKTYSRNHIERVMRDLEYHANTHDAGKIIRQLLAEADAVAAFAPLTKSDLILVGLMNDGTLGDMTCGQIREAGSRVEKNCDALALRAAEIFGGMVMMMGNGTATGVTNEELATASAEFSAQIDRPTASLFAALARAKSEQSAARGRKEEGE